MEIQWTWVSNQERGGWLDFSQIYRIVILTCESALLVFPLARCKMLV
uniref:Uncharacterized protein n=1 Tax=Agrobacterium tumefaciens TaxID=358 RepID=A0A3Q8B1K6_AGRTU|nr:hypothetical protein AgrTiEU6_172 [Agrobacterium tumefaciens]